MNRLPRSSSIPRLRPVRLLAAGALLAAALGAPAEGKMSVIDSPHNLSASGGRGRVSGLPGVSFSEETQICIFCHVPHNATPGPYPLWSRSVPPADQYTPYKDSSTLNASPRPGLPNGSSRLCLSCHDGTIALSKYTRSRITNQGYTMPVDSIAGATAAVNATVNANLGTDLSDDHPISFVYDDNLAQKSHLLSPSALPPQIRLENNTLSGGNVECTACHDPHDNQYGNFLVMNNGSDNPSSPNYMTGSPLCVACHLPEGWSTSSHNNTSIPSLGHQCLSCHTVHSAPGAIRLLQNPVQNMEDNCLANCHNDSSSTATSINVKPLFASTMYHHPIEKHPADHTKDHDELETLPVSADHMHVQCVDCHNPHEVNAANAPLSNPPSIDGRLTGVRTLSGTTPAKEYDICLKCHSGGGSASAVGSVDVPFRVVYDTDENERFNPLNPSFHPVMADRRGTGASLWLNLQAGMMRIYCSDCHNSDQSQKAGGTGPNGPHGSIYPHINIARYYMPPGTTLASEREVYSPGQYALCWRCHNTDYIMTSGTAFSTSGTNHHSTHVRTYQIPCFACHDPHGVPQNFSGVTAVNNAHLINFDRYYAASTAVPNPLYTTNAPGQGSCTVSCHASTAYYGGASSPKQLLQRRGFSVRRVR